MAKKFAGFTLPQQHKLLSRFGYNGPMDQDEIDKFLNAQPQAAIGLGKYAEMANKRLKEKGFATGGDVQKEVDSTGGLSGFDATTYEYNPDTYSAMNTDQKRAYVDQITSQYGGTSLRGDPDSTDSRELYKEQTGQWPDSDPVKYQEWLQKTYNTAPGTDALTQTSDASKLLTEQATQNPEQLLKEAQVAEGEAAQMDEGTGQITGEVPQADVTTVDKTKLAVAPEAPETATYEADTITKEAAKALSTVEAAQAEVPAEATVQGQMELLMADFEDGVPPWAQGATLAATASMQQRGMGASSMAGQAILNATMQAAIPIAQADAQTYAMYDLKNLDNEQQTTMFKAQQIMASMFSDQATNNAAAQFNAMSENQTNQFFAGLQESVSRFNSAQVNGMLQFNAGHKNAAAQFNAQLEEAREQFNAQNAVVIAQSNANWRQQMEMANTSAQNEANMLYAQQLNGLTAAAVDQVWQRERDLMDYAFTSAESALDRELQMFLGNLDAETRSEMADDDIFGSIMGAVAGEAISSIF